jgi:hypothetical protein
VPTSRRQGLLGVRTLTPGLALGIGVAFVVGLLCSYVDLSILLLAWIPFLVGVVSGAFIRSWWGLLLVPIALTLGILPSVIVGSGGFDLTAPSFVAAATLFALLALVEVVVGAAIGIPLGHELEQLELFSNRSEVQ